jgi:hypothetical protein
MTANAIYLYDLLSNGDIDEQTVNDSLEGMDVAGKLEDYCKVIRQFEADAAAYKAEKDRLAAKQKKAEEAVERLEAAVLNYMSATNTEKVKCGVFDVKVKQSKAANIVNADEISPEYMIQQPPKIDRAAIRKALMSGKAVDGAELKINYSINIK